MKNRGAREICILRRMFFKMSSKTVQKEEGVWLLRTVANIPGFLWFLRAVASIPGSLGMIQRCQEVSILPH